VEGEDVVRGYCLGLDLSWPKW